MEVLAGNIAPSLLYNPPEQLQLFQLGQALATLFPSQPDGCCYFGKPVSVMLVPLLVQGVPSGGGADLWQ